MAGYRTVTTGENVVEQHSCPDVRTLIVFAQRQKEGGRPDQMWGHGFEQDATLVQSLTYQRKIKLFEVPEPAMNKLRRPARRSGSEVTLFHQTHRQPSACGVQSHTSARYTPADHHDVERFGLRTLYAGGTLDGSQMSGGVVHAR